MVPGYHYQTQLITISTANAKINEKKSTMQLVALHNYYIVITPQELMMTWKIYI